MPDFVLPETDPFIDDEEDQETTEAKPAGNWRSAPDMDSFLELYAADGGELEGYESQDQEQAVAERDTRIQAAQERQQEVMEKWKQGEKPAWAEAKSLAEMMVLYRQEGNVVGDGWTIAEDPSTGHMQVYEVG